MKTPIEEAKYLQDEIAARSSSPVWLRNGIQAVIDAIEAETATGGLGFPEPGDIRYTGVGLDCVTFIPAQAEPGLEWFVPPFLARAVEVNWSAGDVIIETYEGNVRRLPRRQPGWRMEIAVRRIKVAGTDAGEITLYK